MYWNDETLTIEKYQRKTKHYFCGKELLRFDGIPSPVYTILIVDLDECFCAKVMSDGEIRKQIHMHSEVPKKHKKGGQSAARFGRIRENEITLWFKRINEHLKNVEDDGGIYLGINFMYKARMLNKLSKYNRDKIKRIERNEYGGITGVYQYINKLEKEKGNN